MNKILEEAINLRQALMEDERVQEYFRLKKLFEESEDLIDMRKNLALYKEEGREVEYSNIKELYEHHPIVINFYNSKEEVKDLINDVIEVLDI